MYTKIMVPVDLAHAERLAKALATAADLAGHYRVPVCYVGVTAATPGPLSHNIEEYRRRLATFAGEQAEAHGLRAAAHAVSTHDPTADLRTALLRAVEETGSDLVVMASHLPGLPDHFFASNAGTVASHASVSVFVVR